MTDISPPMYALVGKVTMKEPSLMPVFHGSRASSQINHKGNRTNKQALPQAMETRTQEKQCLCFEKTQNESQLNFPTGEVVPPHTNPATSTNPAPFSLLNITTAPAPNLEICHGSYYHDWKAFNMTHLGMAP